MKAPIMASSRNRFTPIAASFSSRTIDTDAPRPPGLETTERVRRFSTRSVPASQRLEYWNDLTAQTFGPMVIDAPDREAFDAEMAGAPLGEGDVVSTWSVQSTLECKPGAVSAGAADTLNIGVLSSGLSLSRQDGRVWQMRPGDFCLVDPARPFFLSLEGASHLLTLRLPKAQFIERLGDIDHIAGVRVSGSAGPGAALSSLIRGLWPAAVRADSEGWGPGLVEVVLSLVELVYKSPGGHTDTADSVLDVRTSQAKMYIERHLRDPDLTARSIASHLGVSTRYVQLLFAPLGVTPSAYILERRLQLAAAQIRRERRGRVCDIAYEVGFTDLSYFCRVFRRCFGQTPREYRQRIDG
jgi:AraC family transcriptional regulator, positive regulator of tynA and feaB